MPTFGRRPGRGAMRWTAFSLAVAFVVCAPIGQAAAQEKVALVIGNDAYATGAKLDTPARDARAIGQTLQRLGFKLIGDRPLTNLDRATTLRMVEEFSRTARNAQIALFYFSGHGMQLRGKNYLVPV